MSSKSEKSRTIRGSLRPFYRWHRRIGLTASLFVCILAITGIMLNHNVTLNLHKSYITNEWLLNWYNIETPKEKGDALPREVLTLDRVLLDIHTGRFFGTLGPYVMDAAAILLLVLVGTGMYMWWLRNPKTRSKQKQTDE